MPLLTWKTLLLAWHLTLATLPNLLATAYFRKACLAQSMQMFTKAGSQFEEARKKFPDFVDGLILNAIVSGIYKNLEHH